MSKSFDCIVIGGGHNGLTFATRLAKQGLTVLVIEKNKFLGGSAGSYEFAKGYHTPGILHDTSQVRSWIVDDLMLEKFGLSYTRKPPAVFAPQVNGPGLALTYEPQEAQLSLTQLSAKDAKAYIQYCRFFNRIAPFIRSIFDQAPPDVYGMNLFGLFDLMKKAVTLRLLGSQDMMEILRIGPMCVADWLNEWFESEILQALLAGPAIYGNFTGPWSPNTNANLILYESFRQGQVEGGPSALTSALTGAARDAGVKFRTEQTVVALAYEGSTITGVHLADGSFIKSKKVACSQDPKKVFLELLNQNQIPFPLRKKIQQFRSRGTTAKIHLALKRPLEFTNDIGSCMYVRTGETLDDQERAFDAIKYRQLPQNPLLDIYLASAQDPTLAPAGHAVVSILVHFVPFDLAGGWQESSKEELWHLVANQLTLYCPNLREHIVDFEVLTPKDLSQMLGNAHGNIYHGEHSADQIIMRPTPETFRYTTPIKGLYLCGSGSHPGGGITCAPGYLASKALLTD